MKETRGRGSFSDNFEGKTRAQFRKMVYEIFFRNAENIFRKTFYSETNGASMGAAWGSCGCVTLLVEWFRPSFIGCLEPGPFMCDVLDLDGT